MEPSEFLSIMHTAEKLKNNTRHSWTSSGRHESVAEHSWRLCLMVMLYSHELKNEFPDADMDKVLRMCVIHDIGEAFTGDIPAFDKTEADSRKEADIMDRWFTTLPSPIDTEFKELWDEMESLDTVEAKIYKAFDKLEALIQHDESDISTWLPLEYDLQFTYGSNNMLFSDTIVKLRKEVDELSRSKIENVKHKN